jgi:hypothetical protein
MSFDLDSDDQHFLDAMHLHRRHLSEEQLRRYEGYMAEIFTALGLNLDTPATRQTPQRFLQAMFDSTEGYEGDPKLLKVFETECRGGPYCRLSQVVEGPIHALYGARAHRPADRRYPGGDARTARGGRLSRSPPPLYRDARRASDCAADTHHLLARCL